MNGMLMSGMPVSSIRARAYTCLTTVCRFFVCIRSIGTSVVRRSIGSSPIVHRACRALLGNDPKRPFGQQAPLFTAHRFQPQGRDAAGKKAAG